jgi:uncharacterized protein (DUF58 family)
VKVNLSQLWRWPFGRSQEQSDPTLQPLLDHQAILQLLYRVQAHTDSVRSHPKEVQHRLAGDTRSVYRGSGLDFEESRPYQAGDDLRYMNWRLTARSGEPYMKIFREERRPSTFIMVDRRSAMRFGTRQRLKVTQAVCAASLIAFLAMQRGAMVGGVLLQPELKWFKEQGGETSTFDFIHTAAAPCPPETATQAEPALGQVLKLTQAQLTPGTSVALISDFFDLEQSDLPVLLQLAIEHQVEAVQITDPAELSLPDAGNLQIEAMGGDSLLAVDSSDNTVRRAYNGAAEEHYAKHKRIFSAAGIPMRQISTDADAAEVILGA